ncbi:hypothetical protein R5W23_002099 [Gemmata sp. JC673]|uniref:Nuclear transport factor 2 family protein n=1 Tax=Gemmata algarum TaxID=2975278 RepID=A0ABU5F2B2_9BACT|nr:hypothetical protein [Gemmata algarum]MDY3560850.1 hypothetical protein [Gemmata algarum]
MRTCLVTLVIAALPAAAVEPAVPPAPRDTADRHVQTVLKRLKTEGMSGVIEFVFDEKTGSPPAADKRAELAANFLRVRNVQVQALGKPAGDPELLRADVSGRSLVRYVYAEPMERGLVIWQFTFYRAEGGDWRCLTFQSGDGSEAEFRALAADADFADAKRSAGAALDALKAGGVSGLFDVVWADGKNVISAERGPVEKTFAKLRDDAAALLGKSQGDAEWVRTEAVGRRLVRFIYLDKYERGTAVWKFTLYRVGGEWKWCNVNFNGDPATSFSVVP